MKLSIVVRQPWELGYGIKAIIPDADFEFQLDAAGWVGDMRLVLSPQHYRLALLGDEVEVRDERNNVIWAGKIVGQSFTTQQPFTTHNQVRGLCEFAYDLPVDILFSAQNITWNIERFWKVCCNIARQHWPRLTTTTGDSQTGTIQEPIDLRGRTLGDAWRTVNAVTDAVIVPEFVTVKGWANRLSMPLRLRSKKIIINRNQFSEWQMEYDSRQVVNRLVALYRMPIFRNLAPDPSFENIDKVSWVESPAQQFPYGRLQAAYGAIVPWCSHTSLLDIYIPANSTYTLQTAKPIEFGDAPQVAQVSIWVNGNGLGERIRAVVGTTAGSFVTLASGWQQPTWSFSNMRGNQLIKFEIHNPTTEGVRVHLDHVCVYTDAPPTFQPPLLVASAEESLMSHQSFLSTDAAARILACTPINPTTWQVYAPSSYIFSSADVNRPVELWRWGHDEHVSELVRGKIASIVNTTTVRVTITQNPLNVGASAFVGGVFRILNNEPYYGVKYAQETFANIQEANAYLSVHRRPEIKLTATLVDYPQLLTPAMNLIVPEWRDILPEFPLVSNHITVKSGKVVTQSIEAGSREITLRGMLRQINKSAREYVQAR